MKYFTPELWGSNDKNSDLIWKKNCEEYMQIYNRIKKRLPKQFLKTFNENDGLHDFDLKSISVVQSEYKKNIHNPVTVHVDLESPDIVDAVFRITYKYPELFETHYVNVNNNLGFDDYGYSEFLPIDKRTLSHEILFASGATILIHFKDKNITLTKLT